MAAATAISIGMAVASTAASAIQAKKQRDAAKKAAAAQEGAMNEATEEQRRQYEEKKALYGPIEEKLVAEAKSDVPLAYTRQAQEIEKQVSEAQRGMLGRPYGSGVLRSTRENLLLREAEAKAGAYGSALDQQRAMRMQLTQFNPSNQLGAQYADAMNKKSIALADMYSKQRQQAEAAEGAAWQSAIQGAGQVAGGIYGMVNRPQIGSTTTNTNLPVTPMQPLAQGNYSGMGGAFDPRVYETTPISLPWKNGGFDPYKING